MDNILYNEFSNYIRTKIDSDQDSDKEEEYDSDVPKESNRSTKSNNDGPSNKSASMSDVGFEEGIHFELNNQMEQDFPSKVSSAINSGFLFIGGIKLYTKDISKDESEGDDIEASSDKEDSMTSELEEGLGSSERNYSVDTFDSDSDIEESSDLCRTQHEQFNLYGTQPLVFAKESGS